MAHQTLISVAKDSYPEMFFLYALITTYDELGLQTHTQTHTYTHTHTHEIQTTNGHPMAIKIIFFILKINHCSLDQIEALIA